MTDSPQRRFDNTDHIVWDDPVATFPNPVDFYEWAFKRFKLTPGYDDKQIHISGPGYYGIVSGPYVASREFAAFMDEQCTRAKDMNPMGATE